MAKSDRKSKATSDGQELLKKIGERSETIRQTLSPTEIDEERNRVCDLLGRRDNIEAGLKSIKADYKAKLDAVDERIAVARRAACNGFRDVDIDVEEWLTRGNEVVRVTSDGTVLGRRTASADELQESLFADPKSTGDGFPSSEEAFGNAIS